MKSIIRTLKMPRNFIEKRFIRILYICIIFNMTSLSVKGQNPDFSELEKGVVTILNYNSNNEFIGYGSGFFIDKYGTVVTNYHVVKDVHKMIVKTSNGKRYRVKKIISGDEEIDLVKLSLNTYKSDFKFLKISNTPVNKGITCWAMGTPRDTSLSNTLSTGIISNIHSNHNPVWLQTTAQYTHGSSGGPLVNKYGSVVGVTSGGDESKDGARANINFAISIKELNNLKYLNKVRIINPYNIPVNVSFYITYLKYSNDVSISVDGVFRGYFKNYFNSSNKPACGNNQYINMSLLPGKHTYRAYEESTGFVWNGTINIAPGSSCFSYSLENEPNVRAYPSINPQYDIAVKVNGLSCGDELLLANHFGDKQYLKDTAECIDGVFHFKGDEKLQSGVYLVVLPKKNYFEILVSKDENQTTYYFGTDTSLEVNSMVTWGSENNKLFYEFNKIATESGLKASRLKKKYEAEENEDRKEKLKTEIRGLRDVTDNKRKEIVKNYPNLFIGKLYKAMVEVAGTKAPETMDEDQAKKYEYLWMREHYWDNVNMSEDGIVRSPVFHNKIKDYFNGYMPPLPDSAIVMTDFLINKIEKGGSKEQYKYAIHYLTNYFEKSKFMCFDKPLHHMAKNYYCAGKAFWADSEYRIKLCDESAKMEPTLCGVVAPDLAMPDTNLYKVIVMSEIKAPVTVLIFWDINCGHCKKEMPIISQYYDSANKEQVEIYAVYTQGDWEGWKQRVKEEKYNFINVANAFGQDEFRDNYNIRSTPQIYVLDKDKIIKFKKIGANNIKGVVNFLLEEQGIIEKKKDKK